MAHHNARCMVCVADVSGIDLENEVFHIDPSRRTCGPNRARRRLWRYADYEPGPDVIEALLDRNPDGGAKLGPGVRLADLPRPAEREIELINERGTLVAAMLWAGRLATNPGARTATLLPQGHTLSAPPEPAVPSRRTTFDRYLLLPDPAVERAELLGHLCHTLDLAAPLPALGLLTASRRPESPWLAPFEVCEDLPWRPRRVKAWLKARGAGIVEVKTRGRAVDPDQAQRMLRGPGEERYVVFVLRLGRCVRALITRRL
jgi:hypothetical protein